MFNSYDSLGNPIQMQPTSRVDQVIYPSSRETRIGDQYETEPMFSLAVKILVDDRLHVKMSLKVVFIY